MQFLKILSEPKWNLFKKEKKRKWLSMETLTEANKMFNKLWGLKREFYKQINHIEKTP